MFRLPNPVAVADLIAHSGDAVIFGNRDAMVQAVAPITTAQEGCLTFCSAVDAGVASEMVKATPPGVVVAVRPGLDLGDLATDRTLLATSEPRRWFIAAVRYLYPFEHDNFSGISPLAHVSASARVGDNVTIAPFAFVDDEVEIGNGCHIGSGVRIMAGTRLGERVSVQANSVIGMIGLAGERADRDNFIMQPHLAGVVVGDDCRIGPCTTIARGTLQDTLIGRGCIIGSQVNIAHNCTVGNDVLISVGVILTGSAIVEDCCWLAPGVTVANKVRLARWTTVGLGSVVVRDTATEDFVAGNPARLMPHRSRFNKRAGGANADSGD